MTGGLAPVLGIRASGTQRWADEEDLSVRAVGWCGGDLSGIVGSREGAVEVRLELEF